MRRWKFGSQRNVVGLLIPALRRVLRDLPTPSAVGFIGSSRTAAYSRRSFQPCLDLARVAAHHLNLEARVDVLKSQGAKQSSQGYAARFLDIRARLDLRSGARNSAGADLAGARYVLIEDVYTTGATANAAARLLKLGGAKEVHIISALFREELDFS